MSGRTERRESRRPAVFVALAFAVFIVYGALFPFEFVADGPPWKSIFDERNPLRRRADAIDNIMLFVPLGAALWFACRSSVARWIGAATSWLLLGAGLQLLQLYVPSRVASMADAINNAVGLIIGLLLARTLAPWLQNKHLLGSFTDVLALLLVAFWYVYDSFPFLPTLDVGLLAAHIKPALSASNFELLRLIRHLLAASIGTLLLLAARPLSSRRVCVATALAVLLLSEVFVAYGELRMETLLGIALGIAVGERLDAGLGARARWAVLALAGVALVMTVMPGFRGALEASRFTLTPFSQVLWQGGTNGIPTAAFEALAIGALMWAGVSGARPLGSRSWHWPGIVIFIVGALEAVRVAFKSGPADTSTVVSALLLAPFAARLYASRATSPAVSATKQMAGQAAMQHVGGTETLDDAFRWSNVQGYRALAMRALIVWAGMTIGLSLLLELPGVPYNVQEMFSAPRVLSLGLFVVALLWLGAGPWCLANMAVKDSPYRALIWLPILLAVVALVSLFLLRLCVTQESLDDITGSTDLYRRVTTENYWGDAWRDTLLQFSAATISALERGVRYMALYGLLLVPLTMAAIIMRKGSYNSATLPALAVLVLCWWLSAWTVTEGAITDNLTELIAPQGGWWLVALAALFSLNVSWASRRMTMIYGLVLCAITLAMLPLSWWLLKQGLEQTILKYDVVWSAQQFLLGQSRTESLSDGHLFMRWSALYISMLCVCALGMSLARQLWTAMAAAREVGTSHRTKTGP